MPKRRIGSIVFHTNSRNDEVWKKCKEYYVTDREILQELKRYHSVGITGATKASAAEAALLRKLDSGRGAEW